MTTLLDDLLPDYDAVERHATTVRAPRARTWHALRTADLGGSLVTAALLALRALPSRLRQVGERRETGRGPGLTLDGLVEAGFVLIGERPGEEIVLGLVGKFWGPTGALRPFDAAGFRSFDEPGWRRPRGASRFRTPARARPASRPRRGSTARTPRADAASAPTGSSCVRSAGSCAAMLCARSGEPPRSPRTHRDGARRAFQLVTVSGCR